MTSEPAGYFDLKISSSVDLLESMELQDRRPLKLDDLPPEVLDHIMLYMPPSSIVDLMVNRRMRSVCEHHLYRTIRVLNHTPRSLPLLNAFALRPDLALLVRELHINLKWYHPRNITSYKLAALLQPDGLAALSLAKNIRSLETAGLRWLSDPSLTRVREVISQMELTSLSTTGWGSGFPNDDRDGSHSLLQNFLAILRSQPQLESLVITGYYIDASLTYKIEAADVPNLKRFEGPLYLAEAVVDAAPKLTNVKFDLNIGGIYNRPYPRIPNGCNIRDLDTDVYLKEAPNWSSFGGFLASFPNVECLSIAALDWFGGEDDPSSYFDMIVPCLHRLTQLRKLKIGAVLAFPNDPGLTAENILKFKECCPSLERFVDAEDRDWVYVPLNGEGSNFRAVLKCQPS